MTVHLFNCVLCDCSVTNISVHINGKNTTENSNASWINLPLYVNNWNTTYCRSYSHTFSTTIVCVERFIRVICKNVSSKDLILYVKNVTFRMRSRRTSISIITLGTLVCVLIVRSTMSRLRLFWTKGIWYLITIVSLNVPKNTIIHCRSIISSIESLIWCFLYNCSK